MLDNNDNSGHNGNKGKFTERIKKMRRDRLKKKKKSGEENVIITSGRNALKVLLALPAVIYTNISSDVHSRKKDAAKITEELDNQVAKSSTNDMFSSYEISEKKIKIKQIKEINVGALKKQKELLLSQSIKPVAKKNVVEGIDNIREKNDEIKETRNHKPSDNYTNVKDNKNSIQETLVDYEKENRIQSLQKEIINLIKKKLVKNINELETLQSELYVLSKFNNDSTYVDECQENIKEIKKLLSKVKALKEKYDFLKDNIDFEYMLEYGDETLIDKILELKDLCSSDDVRYVVDNYKILNEYKYLYLKIDKLEEDSKRYEEYKENEIVKLKERDIDFENAKKDVYNIERENDRYGSFVKEQEAFLKNLDAKIMNIDSYEQVTYRLKGFNQLVSNSFKYLGLLLASPLRGIVPGIATQTVFTRNAIQNLYRNMSVEEDRKMVYEAIDYSSIIRSSINDLENTANLIDSTLEDIIALKSRYIKEFGKYENSLPGYRDTIKKINKMQNAMLGSKIKMNQIRIKMKEKEKQNTAKMKKVRKMNNSSVNHTNKH